MIVPLLLLSWLAPPQATEAGPLTERELKKIARLSPLGPLPASPTNRVADDPRAAALGHFLFFDPRLSANGEISCATCHDPELGFSDGKSLAEGLARGTRHTPTLWNAAYHRWFFWDGRADSLWSQALGPIENPIEMGTDRLAVAHLVARDPELRAPYEELFGPLPDLADGERFPAHARPGDAGTAERTAWDAMAVEDREAATRVFTNVGKAIEAYERKLVRREAPFDRFAAALAAGDTDGGGELSREALEGLRIFLGRGRCTLCHVGPGLTDLEFHNTSAPPLPGGDEADPGRYRGARLVAESPFNAAGAFSDEPDGAAARRVRSLRQSSESWGEFKTPTLRNLPGRGPFMHQGQLATLADVVRFYSTLEGATGRSHHQEQILVPLRLTLEEEAALVAFLESLSGESLDPHWTRRPASTRPAAPR